MAAPESAAPDAPTPGPGMARWHPAIVRPDLVDGWDGTPEQAEVVLDAVDRALVVRPVVTSPATPGLGLQTPLSVVGAAVRTTGPWAVVHLPSGRLVVRALHDLGLAKHTARQLAALADWSAGYTDLLLRFERTPDLRARVLAVRDQAYLMDEVVREAKRVPVRTAGEWAADPSAGIGPRDRRAA